MTKTIKFSDLEFFEDESRPLIGDMRPYKRAEIFFENGFGASIITGGYTYNSNDKEFELAMLEGTEEEYHIYYDSVITFNTVLGYQNVTMVKRVLNEIANCHVKNPPWPFCHFNYTAEMNR